MKKQLRKIIIVLSICTAFFIYPDMQVNAQPQGSVSYEVFYNNLSPYGQWIDDPDYGRVWMPTVDAGFRPYSTNGHWVMSEYGNMWVSDYPWGWAPFHYGRWTYSNGYGWVWIPDTEWAPAWVSWRSSNDYYGWAPLSPGISISASIGNYNPPNDWWVFLPPRYIYHPHWYSYYHPVNNVTIVKNTTIINNTYINNNHTYIAGPRIEEVKKITNKDVTVYKINNDNKPGNTRIENNTVNVYKPVVQKTGNEPPPQQLKKAEQPIGKPEPIANGKMQNKIVPGNISQKNAVDDNKMVNSKSENNTVKPQPEMNKPDVINKKDNARITQPTPTDNINKGTSSSQNTDARAVKDNRIHEAVKENTIQKPATPPPAIKNEQQPVKTPVIPVPKPQVRTPQVKPVQPMRQDMPAKPQPPRQPPMPRNNPPMEKERKGKDKLIKSIRKGR